MSHLDKTHINAYNHRNSERWATTKQWNPTDHRMVMPELHHPDAPSKSRWWLSPWPEVAASCIMGSKLHYADHRTGVLKSTKIYLPSAGREEKRELLLKVADGA